VVRPNATLRGLQRLEISFRSSVGAAARRPASIHIQAGTRG
jgi:hypothetical protein